MIYLILWLLTGLLVYGISRWLGIVDRFRVGMVLLGPLSLVVALVLIVLFWIAHNDKTKRK